jgi:hypothetical protein
MQKVIKKTGFTLLLFLLLPFCATAQTGSWRAYMSYYEPQQIVKARQYLFVRASNSLYAYNLNDHSITTYDKIRQLSDTYITHIAWNPTVQRLIIVYQNANIDLLDLQENVVNISALYLKTMSQKKTVNSIFIHQEYAYLATGFGIVKVNMKREEITESYILNKDILSAAISGDRIYARTSDGQVLSGLTSQNLINPGNWTAAANVPEGIFDADQSDWAEYQELIATLKPGGPKSNHFGFMNYLYGRLYTSSGGDYDGDSHIQVKEADDWTFYQDTGLSEISGLNSFTIVKSLAVDPDNPNHVFASARNGLYEYEDGVLTHQYNQSNSPIEIFDKRSAEYQLVYGSICDDKGNVWCLNSQAYTRSVLKMNMATREWTAYNVPELMFFDSDVKNKSLPYLMGMMTDHNGYIWFVNNHWIVPSVYCFDPQAGTIRRKYTGPFINQDGTSYNNTYPTCVAEDLSNNIWIGTTQGLFMLDAAQIEDESNTRVTQVKVPRNDGTDLADYLLTGTAINAIAIDKGNRKWFGTQGAGLYLISADNIEEVEHFTTSNSPILSNNIESIAIDHTNGEVFIGTDAGLCSYMGDATTSAETMQKNDVYVFPNPVPSSYNGMITIRGLTFDADVKILTVSGRLVAAGRSNGGSFTWDGRDSKGRRVASGVYMIATATSSGESGVVAKVAMIK